MGKVTHDIAEKEVNAWLDHKLVSESKREEKKSSIDALIKSVESGELVLDDKTFKFKQKLAFPVGSEIKISELEFDARINVGKLQINMTGVRPDDLYGMVIAHTAALTNQSKAIIKALDKEDYDVASKVATFFL